ncbi:MAG: hypothetical protein RR034_05740 [Bacteroidales bacterium]
MKNTKFASSSVFSSWIDLLLKSLFFITVVYLISFLRVDKFFFNFSYYQIFQYWGIPFLFMLYFLYRNMQTITFVDKILIDSENQLISVEYWLFYFIKKKTCIKFDELSFKYKEDHFLFFGSILSLFLYRNNKFIIRVNVSNGWNKNQIIAMIDHFGNVSHG